MIEQCEKCGIELQSNERKLCCMCRRGDKYPPPQKGRVRISGRLTLDVDLYVQDGTADETVVAALRAAFCKMHTVRLQNMGFEPIFASADAKFPQAFEVAADARREKVTAWRDSRYGRAMRRARALMLFVPESEADVFYEPLSEQKMATLVQPR